MSKLPVPLLLLSITLSGCVGPTPDSPTSAFYERVMIDLTHPFDSETIYWPNAGDFELSTDSQGYTDRGYYYEAHRFSAAEHGGTHLDAPIHFYEGRNTVDRIPLEQLVGPGIVVDVVEPCAVNRDYRIGLADFEAWELRNGKIPDRAIVLLRTGFGRYWPDRALYMGTDERGDQGTTRLHFPGLDPDAVPWLVEKRRISAIGLDTPSIDHGPSTQFEAHVALFEMNVPALENVANLHELPENGFSVIALPMKIRGGSGGPTRIVAVLD
jgi:kynurenine formamidase